MKRRRRCRTATTVSDRRGFTLAELAAVIGIIALLLAITIPTVVRSRKAAAKAKTARDLQAISMGLDEYKNNFGEYPQAYANNLDGCTALFQALSGTIYNKATKQFDPIRSSKSGRPQPPLIQVDKFNVKTNILSGATPLVWFRDSSDQPFLYFPAAVPQPDVTQANRYVFHYTGTGGVPLYNHTDCPNDPGTGQPYLSVTDMQYLLGDGKKSPPFGISDAAPPNGKIDTGETAVKLPYLLWAAGADGNFGIAADGKTDDVILNLDVPPPYRK
jgi:prepilin-type N-terminal cleavage/methylation domain-containing protein